MGELGDAATPYACWPSVRLIWGRLRILHRVLHGCVGHRHKSTGLERQSVDRSDVPGVVGDERLGGDAPARRSARMRGAGITCEAAPRGPLGTGPGTLYDSGR